jgi:hypothetical protein
MFSPVERAELSAFLVEGVQEHGKLWCLVHHMWKVLWPHLNELAC